MLSAPLKASIRRILGLDPDFRPNQCYGQDGEDLILDRMLDRQASGFFVDVGAHHPVRFSNTYLFYQRGWRGINVDAQPGSMTAFRKYRERDINLEFGIDLTEGSLPYYQFNEPALNTFDEAEARLKDIAPYRIVGQVVVPVRRLANVLDQYLPSGMAIDFISVDVEGKDLSVLQSNDWSRYRPRFVLAETLRTELLKMSVCPVVAFMQSVGYVPVAKAYNTTFFERSGA
jgi:FkbM family methyltransferase